MHVDARKLADCVRQGDFKGGFAALAAAVPLPQILSRICDHPCQLKCKRSEAGEAISIQLLERACAEYSDCIASSRAHGLKNQKVAVFGGDLSGISAAILLATKGYQVTVFEPRPHLLDRLRGLGDEILPEKVIDADLEVLVPLAVEVRCSTLLSPEEIENLQHEFDACFFSGMTEYLFARGVNCDPITLATSEVKLFRGQCDGSSPITAVYEGSTASVSIDRFLQGASLTANRDGQGPYESRLYVNTKNESPLVAIRPSVGPHRYSREEARAEAERCFPCQCLECVKVCEYLKQYGAYPKRYVREIYNNECIVMGQRKANRMVNSCALCGLCTSVCPEKLSMADVCLDARQSMVKKGKMPPSAHEFALRDMAFSTSDAFTLARHQPGHDTSKYAFLPGCQLSASSPQHVSSCYEYLRNNLSGGVGLMLACCGAPAHWAGEEKLFQETRLAFKAAWESLGKPILISACSSCYRVVHDFASEIPVESLWPHIDPSKIAASTDLIVSRALAIHDPCSTREFRHVEDGARSLLQRLGVEVKELNDRGLTTCCGYGGLMQFANPELADKTVVRRGRESDEDFVTYCAMCRDRFAHNGKRAVHILDLLFPVPGLLDPASRSDPGFSWRQEQRARLKVSLLRELWGEQEVALEPKVQLVIAEEVRSLLEKRMILVEDVRKVVEHAEQTGEKFEDPASGHLLASYRPSCVTYWVEYSIDGNGYVIYNAYSHRMQVV